MSDTDSTSTLTTVVQIDDIAPVEVVAGITRRRLTHTEYARGWLIDFAPGTEWPEEIGRAHV